MRSSGGRVFVLGAGFTKAFFPNAPLIEDDYGIQDLENRFAIPSYASRIIGTEMQRQSSSSVVNIERLLTRVDGLMPYDEPSEREELKLLKIAVKKKLVERIMSAREQCSYQDDLKAFAKHCIEDQATCITFNYDDFLDEVLWHFNPVENLAGKGKGPFWHPNGGYGFFCKPGELLVIDFHSEFSNTSMLLLKLHGSINWRIRIGAVKPYSPDSVFHYEEWIQPLLANDNEETHTHIKRHLEQEPFIVPPILMKSSLLEQPVLRIVWKEAHKALSQANRVTFIGYSLPVTDIAASFLFSETLSMRDVEIKVINKAENEEQTDNLKRAYRATLPNITDKCFEFVDAREWIKQNID